MKTATLRWASLALLALAGPAAFAQTQPAPLGDEFILFVDGTNVLIPTVDGTVVADPADLASGNKVIRFNPGAYTHGGFSWERSTGVDASASVGRSYGEGDTLYLRLRSGVENANAVTGTVNLWLTDKTDGRSASRVDLESGAAEADIEMRLRWTIPQELHDGMWHDLAIPLPPATYDSLEAARTRGVLDANAANWQYTGAWTAGAAPAGGYGIGSVGNVGAGPADPLFKEFEWNALYKIGPVWDNNGIDDDAQDNAGAPIFLDNVYIGGPNTRIASATEPPAAMSGVSFQTDGEANLVSWASNPAYGGYNVYASQSEITDVNANGVLLLKRVGAGGETQLRHRYEIPHPSLGDMPLYYAVTSLSPFGVENTSVAASAGSITNADLPQKAFIRQLTTAEADSLFDAQAARRASDAGFPANMPVFRVDSSHRSPGDGSSVADLPTDEDLSGRFKVGYTDLNEMYIYGEITDDQVTFGGEGVTGANSYLYDSAEIVFGYYDVRDTDGGGLLAGSPHITGEMLGGDEPDYGIRISAFTDASGNIARRSTWVGWSLDIDLVDATAVEKTDTGWKFLTILPLNSIQSPQRDGRDADVYMGVPDADEIRFIPFVISINDADGEQRESQIIWSIKPNANGVWWQSPNQWETVAIAGRGVEGTTAVEDGSPQDGFSLAQSTPNPAFGEAKIAFSLGTPSRATVEVFNVLGQRVMMAAEGEFAAGPHEVSVATGGLAAGVYVYRLSAGDYVATRRMTVVR